MRSGDLARLFAALLAWLAVMAAGPAVAAGFLAGSTCHVAASRAEDYAGLARQPDRWTCHPDNWDISGERAMLRFDLTGRQGGPVTRFATRLTEFAALRLDVVDASGRRATRVLADRDMTPASDGWMMSAALPSIPREGGGMSAPRLVVVTVEGARHPGMLSAAMLEDAGQAATIHLGRDLLSALLCGMLFMPLISNLAFWGVLRQRFLLWHTAAVVLMLVQTLVTTGLVNNVMRLSVRELCVISAISFGGGIAAAAQFAADLLEPEALDPWQRRLLRATALWIPAWVAVYLWAGGPLRPWAWAAYYVQFLPVLVLFAALMVVARLRGSRSVNFQIVAWAPIMTVGLLRIASAMGLSRAPLELEMPQHVALAWEVIISALSVADRFLIVRRERDRARAQAQVMGALAEHDPLTGLLNRRSIEERFAALWGDGFRAMAIIDVDHFKDINDGFGHATGDVVLRALAEALAPDENVLAVRMGGEEFLLLLRGKDVSHRAEIRRRAITSRIAIRVPGLDRPVTASMGLVVGDAELTAPPPFLAIYEKCDSLLYRAKNQGRNRTIREHFDQMPASAENGGDDGVGNNVVRLAR